MDRTRFQPHQRGSLHPVLNRNHNNYPDLKNNWAPNAKGSERDSPSGLICIMGILFLVLGMLLKYNISRLQQLPLSTEKLTPRDVVIEKPEPMEPINFAADFNGAQINYKRTSESLFTNEILHWKIIYDNVPDNILSQDNSAGNCWAFNGDKGIVTITLLQTIYPRHFTIAHEKLVDNHRAPKEICVYNQRGKPLGCHLFFIQQHKETFACQSYCDEPLEEAVLEIRSNHGASETCVYQFMIHGEIVTNY